jgi:hypothetical protein
LKSIQKETEPRITRIKTDLQIRNPKARTVDAINLWTNLGARYGGCSFDRTMIKSIFTFIAISSLLGAAPAFAKTLKLPSDEFPIASITFPDDWEPEEVNNGVAGQSPDTAVYLAAVAVGSEKGMDAELDDTFAFLKEHKVELDKSTKKENKFKLNDVEVEELIFHGKDEDGPTSVSISFIPIKDKIVVLTYWVTTEKEKKHQEEVGKILQSIKPEK